LIPVCLITGAQHAACARMDAPKLPGELLARMSPVAITFSRASGGV